MTSRGEVTQMLLHLSSGDSAALDRLLPLVYDELRKLAARALKGERPDHTLEATALAHEAYLKLVDQRRVRWQNRAHFLGVAATAIRRILVDHARAKGAARRGGGRDRVPLGEEVASLPEPNLDLVALHEAMERLHELDPRKARLVELRFFGGLTVEETAEVQSISRATVEREWHLARAWLHRQMSGE